MTHQSQLQLDKKVVARMLADDGTMATCLQIIAWAAYGDEIFQVDPMEVVLRLEEDFGIRLTEDNENKLKAILLSTTTDSFYENPDAFEGICNTLLNGDPGLGGFDPVTVPEVLWSLYEVELSHGPMTMLPGVQAALNDILDNEMTEPDGDAIQVDPYQYAWDFMAELHSRLKNQLTELGVPIEHLPPIQTPALLQEA